MLRRPPGQCPAVRGWGVRSRDQAKIKPRVSGHCVAKAFTSVLSLLPAGIWGGQRGEGAGMVRAFRENKPQTLTLGAP